MPQFTNNPAIKGQSNEGMIKRYVHQPLTVEHYGLHAQIQENGRVKITGQMTKTGNKLADGSEEYEYDEVDIPASLVFKLASLLKATRTIKFVSVQEAATLPVQDVE